MNQFSEAFVKSGIAANSRLWIAAKDAVQKKGSPDRALSSYRAQVIVDQDLLNEQCMIMLRLAFADLRGNSLTGGGQNGPDAHIPPAIVGQLNEGGAGHSSHAAQAICGLPAPSSQQASDVGHLLPAEQSAAYAVPTSDAPPLGGTGQYKHDTHIIAAGSAEPATETISEAGRILQEQRMRIVARKPQNAADIARIGLYVCKLRDGTDLADEKVGMTKRIVSSGWFELAMRCQLLRYTQAPTDAAVWRDLVAPDVFDVMKATALQFKALCDSGISVSVDVFLDTRIKLLEASNAA